MTSQNLQWFIQYVPIPDPHRTAGGVVPLSAKNFLTHYAVGKSTGNNLSTIVDRLTFNRFISINRTDRKADLSTPTINHPNEYKI